MTVTSNYDWSEFSIHMYYQATLDQVWNSWATPAGLESFFVAGCEVWSEDGSEIEPNAEIEADSSYRWRWRHGYELRGRFTAVEAGERLEFTFGDMTVGLQIEDSPHGVMTLLHQTNIPNSQEGMVRGHLNCRSCWIYFMTNLASVLATGIDLRHPNPSLVSSMEVGFDPAALEA